MKIGKTIIAILMCMSIAFEASASVIGELTDSADTNFGAGAVLYKNTFSDGKNTQREFFVDYTPNSEAVPVVLNGTQIYGKRSVLEAAKYYDSLDYRPLLGINADYFSFKTGIPMGHTISGGDLITSDTTGQNAIGFLSDGKAFISWLEIQTKLTASDGTQMNLDCINKWLYPGAVASYFMSDYFGPDTKTSGKCRYVVFSKTSGRIKIGEEAVFKVEDKFDAEINIAIPDGKYVLAMDLSTGNPSSLDFMNRLTIGQEVKMTNEAVYDKELWHSAENGLGSVGGRLIENGNVYSNFEKGTAPRTAVGIRADGKVIFYVVDGRQTGYSTGLTLEKLANRMSELGCVDAINLDGGGSTVIAGVYPGSDTFDVINRPSEGSLRNCANYIFLQDMRKPSGIASKFTVDNEQNANYLTGTKAEIKISDAWDTNNFKMGTENFSYEVVNGESTSAYAEGNVVTLIGNGTVNVNIGQGGISKPLVMNVYDFPDSIKVTDKNGSEITSLSFKTGDSYSEAFNCAAYLNGYLLKSDAESFSYEAVGDIGSFSGNVFTANTNGTKNGKIIIKGGQFEKTINVTISDKNSYFADMDFHWSKQDVNSLYEKNIISGEEKDGSRYYYPDNKMTRIEFASIICKYLGINVDEYSDKISSFGDRDEFAPWMRGYINAMSETGIINGIDGDFKPNELLTRAQAATIIGRILPEEEDLPTLSFADSSQIPDWAYYHMAKLVLNEIIRGYEDNTLRPGAYVTRGEAAAIINKL